MNIYDIKKNTIMKKLKYVKLFESFVNEELSPELKKRTYDAMVKIAQDPNAIDKRIKSGQATNIESMLAPSVKSALERLKSAVGKIALETTALEVTIYDNGMSEGTVSIHIGIHKSASVTGYFESLLMVLVTKDKYQQSGSWSSSQMDANQRSLRLSICDQLQKDRAVITSLKNLIVEIQKNEIPGEEEVPSEPTSVTKEGEIVLNTNTMEEDDISKYGTGGSGLPDFRSEAGQIARGR